ncbi:type III-B CRISPR module RAMP protein Cmr4 [Pontiella sp.]|uniref:type III-B CRISPR module RAMP protein Cmr4 n=1 Tax=Pontiella sp. TaxID=2837462 RepID=UPI0035661B97
MKKMTMTLFARTPVHVGAGNSVGAVDAPIQRERHTRIPIIPGSSLKGVLADLWNERGDDGQIRRTAEGKKLFGEDEGGTKKDGVEIKAQAGALLIGEARVLAFPVRSAKGMFAWITCPLVLRRFQRETGAPFEVPNLGTEEAMAFEALKIKGQVVLEEYNFNAPEEPPQAIVDAFRPLVGNDSVWAGIGGQLVVVSDEIFQHFCEHACEVVTRIRINDETGTVDGSGLFNQEQVPSETLFYTSILSPDAGNLAALKTKLETEQWLQIGGDATIGLGFCTVNCKEVE